MFVGPHLLFDMKDFSGSGSWKKNAAEQNKRKSGEI